MKNVSLRKNLSNPLIIIYLAMACSSCEDFVKIDAPKTEMTREAVFSDDRAATSAISGIYSQMMETSEFAGFHIGYYCALSADEIKTLLSTSDEERQFENNFLIPINSALLISWELGYRYIWYANSIIEGLSGPTGVSNEVRMQVLGEAKFIRAFCHFYLTNLFGSVPYITSTDYRVNAVTAKLSQAEVYGKMIQDLTEAQNNLADPYITSERVRPNRGAATALLARVYLYAGNWSNAEIEATKVIGDAKYRLEDDLSKVFLSTSQEAIWQLKPVNPGHNTFEGHHYNSSGNSGGLSLTDELIGAFELNDNRFRNWINSRTTADGAITTYYPYKYKVQTLGQAVTEYNMVFRLAEVFLIRAEAKAHSGQLTGPNSAEFDLNAVRTRAGLSNTTATTMEEFLDAILHERRVELFTEWGHRWLDLKRTGKADLILSALKSDWQPTDVLYPIPKIELERNKNLLPQNEGYE